MDGSQWIVGANAGDPDDDGTRDIEAAGAEDWLPRETGHVVPATKPANPRPEPAAGQAPGANGIDEELSALYERTSRIQACVEELDRRARQVSRRVSSLSAVLPSRNGFVPAQAPTAFVPSRSAQRSSRSKATAVPIRSIVEGWVPKKN